MDLIDQKLVVKDWPLKKPGDACFFGYVVAMGLFPHDWNRERIFSYADFAHGRNYSRYRLPKDEGLRTQLAEYVSNAVMVWQELEDLDGKIWIRLTEKGHEIYQP